MTNTPQTIAAAIREAVMRFYMQTAIRPDAIYLGRHDSAALDSFASPYLRFDLPRDLTSTPKRRRFEDIEIFTVDADDHLAVNSSAFPPKP